ncbi:MAG: OmpA family protein [Rhodospirillales bacterium]|nr:OmpA family protein [Rhodospirillales bacterium]
MSKYKLLKIGGHFTAVTFAVSLLGSCSQLPDAVNPVEWYNSSVDFFVGNEEKEEPSASQQAKNTLEKNRGKALPGANKEFPKIATVDQQRDYYEARKRGGLVADTEGRNYAPAIARQGEASSRLAAAPPPEPKAAEQQPAPPATPTTPVTTEEVLLAPSSGPSAAKTASASLPSTGEQMAFQARLQKRLDEIRARAGQPPAELPTSMADVIAPDDFGTVIVNSTGIRSSRISSLAINPASVKAAPLPANPLTHISRPARPLAAGVVKVATIHFRNGSSALTTRDRQIIANALQLKKERGGRIHIIGHASSRTRSTDPVRHKMLNFKVSVDRADAVARELIRLGVKKKELVVDAISDAQPVYFEFMPTGEAGNRRAEIYLES